jgi:hypothetical protein
MSFYKSKSGMKMDGSEEVSHAKQIKIIPNDTHATASIKKYELVTNDNGKYYQLTWKLLDTSFKGLEVRQNIKAFDADLKKADRAVNMMIRLFKLADYKPGHDLQPENKDLAPMIGKILGIVINEIFIPDANRTINFISEVHSVTGFETKDGEHVAYEATPSSSTNSNNSSVDSAFSRNNTPPMPTDDDIPW